MFFRSFTVLAATITISQSAFASLAQYSVGNEVTLNTTVSHFARTVKEASLSQMNLDLIAFPGVKSDSGIVRIDHAQLLITLIIQQNMPLCPQDMMCIQMMPAPLVIELPLVAKQTDSCGTVTYTARLDQRPVDGLLQELVVKDNTKFNCIAVGEIPATEVEYTTQATETTRSTFLGGMLR